MRYMPRFTCQRPQAGCRRAREVPHIVRILYNVRENVCVCILLVCYPGPINTIFQV